LIGPGAAEGIDFEAVETAVRREAMRIAARAVERRLNADHSDHNRAWLPCACGGQARYGGRRPKSFMTVLGELIVQYVLCEFWSWVEKKALFL
jgi:hypothetical protein